MSSQVPSPAYGEGCCEAPAAGTSSIPASRATTRRRDLRPASTRSSVPRIARDGYGWTSTDPTSVLPLGSSIVTASVPCWLIGIGRLHDRSAARAVVASVVGGPPFQRPTATTSPDAAPLSAPLTVRVLP